MTDKEDDDKAVEFALKTLREMPQRMPTYVLSGMILTMVNAYTGNDYRAAIEFLNDLVETYDKNHEGASAAVKRAMN